MNRLKVIVVMIALSFGVYSFAQKKGYDLNWLSDIEQAKTLAKNENKLILIYFTSSDASNASKELNKDLFYTAKFKKLSEENLVLVRVNIPRRTDLISDFQKTSNRELSNRYHQKVIPTVVLCDATGKKLGVIESYNYLHDTSKHYALINKALKKN